MSRADEIRELLCSDEPADHERARQLAQGSDGLQALLDEHGELMASISAWKTEAQAPAVLRERILEQVRDREAIADEPAPSPVLEIARSDRFTWRVRSWQGALAVAATLVVVTLATRTVVYEPVVISTSGRLVVSNALAAAHEAEQRHAEAIADLQRAADPILNRAHDPQTGAAEAALLLAYRDRISAIDSAIAEVNSYLDENPGLASARTVLLAAYIDKTRILEEVLGRDERGELG
jgi:hypothetical protein